MHGENQHNHEQDPGAKASFYDRGWRPAIGWTCASALFLFYIPQFLFASGVWLYQCVISTAGIPPYPVTMDEGLWQLVVALLGMAGIRSLDKAKGTAR